MRKQHLRMKNEKWRERKVGRQIFCNCSKTFSFKTSLTMSDNNTNIHSEKQANVNGTQSTQLVTEIKTESQLQRSSNECFETLTLDSENRFKEKEETNSSTETSKSSPPKKIDDGIANDGSSNLFVLFEIFSLSTCGCSVL